MLAAWPPMTACRYGEKAWRGRWPSGGCISGRSRYKFELHPSAALRIFRAMSDLTRWHRTARVFLARLLMVHGEDAPDVLRRMADELEWLEAERAAESAGPDLDPRN